MTTKMHNLVTNEEYKKFKQDHNFEPGRERKPVTNINFHEATAYAEWLSKQTGRKFRLPTENELKKEESTFKADFSLWPLAECPDVGTVGSNENGVTDLLGVVYTWTANNSDVELARKKWKSMNKQDSTFSDTTKEPEPSLIVQLQTKIEILEKELSDTKIALKIVKELK